MKAVTVKSFGGPEVLEISTVPKPKVKVGQLLVKVHATALNRADTLQRKGKYPPPSGESAILGLEIAGEVEEVGAGVEKFKLGQRVFGLVGGGGYSEYCVIDAAMAMPMPKAWSYEYAAAIPEVFLTANETIFQLGELKAGESILIHAGGSGVGTAGIQMAHHLGATVYFTAGSEDKITKALALGADLGINYKTQDFAKVINEITKGEGVDVVEDFLGASYFQRNLQILKPAGRLVQVALMSGSQTDIDLRLVLSRRLQIKGSVMRTRSLDDKRQITQRFIKQWLPILKSGDIKPIIDSIYPLEQVRQAHEAMEANQNFGKIILSLNH